MFLFVLVYRDFELFFMLLYFTSRFTFLYFQILSHIYDFLNQRRFLRSKRMRWRGVKLGVFMEPCWWDSLLIQSLYDSTLVEVLSWDLHMCNKTMLLPACSRSLYIWFAQDVSASTIPASTCTMEDQCKSYYHRAKLEICWFFFWLKMIPFKLTDNYQLFTFTNVRRV